MSYETALKYVDKGLLNRTVRGNYELFCYSKETFFNHDWDDITVSHRGTLYHNEKQVNKPFNKIFNLDEDLSTEYERVLKLMDNYDYDVYDKANGHLFIVSVFKDDYGVLHTVFSTKGSLPHEDNELLRDDVRVFEEKYMKGFSQYVELLDKNQVDFTMMFEPIVRHDKHTMYDQQVKQYGEDSFVLLGINHISRRDKYKKEWSEATYHQLCTVAEYIGTPVVKRYERSELDFNNIKEWFEHTDREGYVIHFPDLKLRAKIKTKEYWALRFKKDLTPERILQIFEKGGIPRLKMKLPEEVSDQLENVISVAFLEWAMLHFQEGVDLSNYVDNSLISNKEIMLDKSLTANQKKYIITVRSRKTLEGFMTSKAVRSKFVECMAASDFSLIDGRIEDIVDNL